MDQILIRVYQVIIPIITCIYFWIIIGPKEQSLLLKKIIETDSLLSYAIDGLVPKFDDQIYIAF